MLWNNAIKIKFSTITTLSIQFPGFWLWTGTMKMKLFCSACIVRGRTEGGGHRPESFPLSLSPSCYMGYSYQTSFSFSSYVSFINIGHHHLQFCFCLNDMNWDSHRLFLKGIIFNTLTPKMGLTLRSCNKKGYRYYIPHGWVACFV